MTRLDTHKSYLLNATWYKTKNDIRRKLKGKLESESSQNIYERVV